MQEITSYQFTLDTLQLEQTFILTRNNEQIQSQLPTGNYRVICGELVRIVKGAPLV